MSRILRVAGAVWVATSVALTGCISLGGDSYRSTVRKEVAELLRSYRKCLQKYEDQPAKARDTCGVYREAIQELAPPDQRRTVGDFLDRFLRGGRERTGSPRSGGSSEQ